jgi:hypothetical protein
MSTSFRKRLEQVVAELRAHSRIEVYDFVIRPPASKGDITAAEDAVGMKFPADIRDFYRAHDGIFLLWGLRGIEYRDRPALFGQPDYGAPPGCINLLSIGEAMSSHWQSESHVNEIDSDHQKLLFGAELDPLPKIEAVCIDNYSMYNHGDMIFGPEPVVVVSTDHGADLEASDFCSFSVYLDLVIAQYGSCRYKNGIGIGWSREPERVTAWTKKRSLDEIVAAVYKDGPKSDNDEDADDAEDDSEDD